MHGCLTSCLIALFLTGPAAFATEPGEPAPALPRYTLKQALKRALDLSPDYDVAKRTESTGKLAYKNSWAALLPEADIEALHTYTQVGGPSVYQTNAFSANPNSPWSDVFTFGVTENLYDNGDSWRLMKIADLTREIDSLQRKRREQQLMLDVSRAFYAYSSAVGQLELQREEIEALRVEFRTIEGR